MTARPASELARLPGSERGSRQRHLQTGPPVEQDPECRDSLGHANQEKLSQTVATGTGRLAIRAVDLHGQIGEFARGGPGVQELADERQLLRSGLAVKAHVEKNIAGPEKQLSPTAAAGV